MKITKLKPTMPSKPVLKKVAAYCRVSRETTRLLHSLSAQISYYSEKIQSNPEWEYAGVYADSGISGMGTENRSEFNCLLEDCEAGKVDIILTKSVSRFARNTVDLLETVRHLRQLGISVRFEEQNIDTMSGDGELMLSILACFAQQESLTQSDNIKWAKQKAAKEGKPSGGFAVYGYRWNGENFIVEPKEAEIVKLIFSNYLNGIYAYETSKQLKSMGVKGLRGGGFDAATIQQILKNEKYTGCLLLQKGYVSDPLKKKRKVNQGEMPMYFVENSHEAIISREDFDKVQAIMKKRNELGALAYDGIHTTCFTKKLCCSVCRKFYQRKTSKTTGGALERYWRCATREKYGKDGCVSIPLEEEHLKAVCSEVLGMDEFSDDAFLELVDKIAVQPNGNEPIDGESKDEGQTAILEFHLNDGTILTAPWIPTPKPSRSERMKGNTYGKSVKWSEERRKAQSERMKKRMAERWERIKAKQQTEEADNG